MHPFHHAVCKALEHIWVDDKNNVTVCNVENKAPQTFVNLSLNRWDI